MMKLYKFLSLIAFVLYSASMANAATPITTDSRIKTFVYNENDVFSLLTNYGYQSSIEFSKGESVKTISIGDRVAWQIVPAGYRIFIRALEENSHTNMTIVTNKHAYQFDLKSTGENTLKPSEELSYVIRFYYPSDDENNLFSRPIEAKNAMISVKKPNVMFNTNYTYTGVDRLAPQRMFDNGRATFIKLAKLTTGVLPRIFILRNNQEIPVQVKPVENGFLMINQIARRFVVKYNNDESIYIYNENI